MRWHGGRDPNLRRARFVKPWGAAFQREWQVQRPEVGVCLVHVREGGGQGCTEREGTRSRRG